MTEEEAIARVREKITVCVRCGRQRWAPQVPEAYHGWVEIPSGWRCPQCREGNTIPVVEP